MYAMLGNQLCDIEAREWYVRRGGCEMHWAWRLALKHVVSGDERRQVISQQ